MRYVAGFWSYGRDSSQELAHYGITGQQWGVRRYQNEDGSLTEEGRLRYLGSDGSGLTNDTAKIYDRAIDRFNRRELGRINKKYDNVDLINDDRANLEYTKEIVESWKREYRNELAKDLGTDPKTLEGAKWLDDIFGYKSYYDEEVSRLEKKVNGKNEPKKEPTAKNNISSSGSGSNKTSSKSSSSSVKSEKPEKMTPEKALSKAYDALEKKYPNFNDFSYEKQDKLLVDYLNDSGLYKYI